MKSYYFVVDDSQQLHRVFRTAVEKLWNGHRNVNQWNFKISESARILTVLCDDDDLPFGTYFMRLQLKDGAVPAYARDSVCQAVDLFGKQDLSNPVLRYQYEGWPENCKHQLAVVMDLPILHFKTIGLGGPLPISNILNISLDECLDTFEEMHQDE